jgi:hypothetical protein
MKIIVMRCAQLQKTVTITLNMEDMLSRIFRRPNYGITIIIPAAEELQHRKVMRYKYRF